MKSGHIASVGECMLELSGAADGGWNLGYAGDTFNTLWALRALTDEQHAADYVSAFGDDPFSEKQIAFFGEAGIGIADSPVIPAARPGLYAITLTGAERSFTYWRNDAAARQLASDPARLAKSFAGRALIYFSGITLAIVPQADHANLFKALADARQVGSVVAFDPNYRPRLWPSAESAKAALAAALTVPAFPRWRVV